MASISMAPVASIGAEIKRLREAAGLAQKDLARALGLKVASQVSQWETGERIPGADNLARIAAALCVPVNHFDAFGRAYTPTARKTKRQKAATGTAPPIDSASASATLPPSTQQERPGAKVGQEVDDVEFSEEERHVHRLLHAALHLSGKAVLEQVTSLIGRALSGGAARPKAARRAGAGRRSKQSHG